MTMDRCPYAPKKARGAHCFSAVIPEDTGHPVLLFCDRCGASLRLSIDDPLPVDDWPADAIAQLARRTHA